MSYAFGITFEYKLKKKLSLVSNINYYRKMMKWGNFRNRDSNGNDYSVEDKIKFSYINIPVLIRYYVGNKIYTNVGGFYNHSLNIENDTTINQTGESITFWEYKNIIKKYDYGLSLGIGFGFDLNEKNHLSIELKDELGLANIADYPNTRLTDLKTNNIKLILNWELPI